MRSACEKVKFSNYFGKKFNISVVFGKVYRIYAKSVEVKSAESQR